MLSQPTKFLLSLSHEQATQGLQEKSVQWDLLIPLCTWNLVTKVTHSNLPFGLDYILSVDSCHTIATRMTSFMHPQQFGEQHHRLLSFQAIQL